jgi:hypothetical protein
MSPTSVPAYAPTMSPTSVPGYPGAVPQNAVPFNSALSMASILRLIPPELLGRLASPGPGQPSAAIGLGQQPTLASPYAGPRWE